MEFLNETDKGVEQEQSANDTEIDPVLETGGQNSSSLHDELNGTNKEAKELEHQVLLLFFHLVKTVLATAGNNLSLGQTKSAVGLEHVVGDDTSSSAGTGLFLFFFKGMAILGFEILDQGVNVLVFFLVFSRGVLLGRDGLGRGLGTLLVEVARFYIHVERGRADGLVVRHGQVFKRWRRSGADADLCDYTAKC